MSTILGHELSILFDMEEFKHVKEVVTRKPPCINHAAEMLCNTKQTSKDPDTIAQTWLFGSPSSIRELSPLSTVYPLKYMAPPQWVGSGLDEWLYRQIQDALLERRRPIAGA